MSDKTRIDELTEQLLRLKAESIEREAMLNEEKLRVKRLEDTNKRLVESHYKVLKKLVDTAKAYNAFHSFISECYATYISFGDTITRVKVYFNGKRTDSMPASLSKRFSTGLERVSNTNNILEKEFDRYPLSVEVSEKDLRAFELQYRNILGKVEDGEE